MKEIRKPLIIPDEIWEELLHEYRKELAAEIKKNGWLQKEFGWQMGWQDKRTSKFFKENSGIGAKTMMKIVKVMDNERYISLCTIDRLEKAMEKYGQ
jgi:hypothetical protein